jgi:tryptophan-rich sensory protein
MQGWRALAAAASVLLVVGYAVGSGVWASANPGWYAGLTRPAWQPPDVVFAVIWPLNFLALGVVGVLVTLRATPPVVGWWLAALAITVLGGLAWSYLFYVLHALAAAAAALGLAAASATGLIIITWPVSHVGALALLPYTVWVSLATSLAVEYARLNA